MTNPQDHGVVDLPSRHGVVQTLDRLEALVKERGMLVFTRIDFSGDAARAGMSMRPMQMLLFGNPRGGTPMLVAAPRVGLDLPLKALAWEDENGAVWLSSNAPSHLEARHGVPHALLENIAGAAAILQKAAAA